MLTRTEIEAKLKERNMTFEYFLKVINEGPYKLDQEERDFIKQNPAWFHALVDSIWHAEEIGKIRKK